MTQNKTKKALLMSVLSMMLCVAMLVGMTFAWFTDTASTNVNTIQAGNLKVSLVDGDGNDLTNEKIQWTAKGADKKQHPVENPLWEPGCTFRTEQFYLRNDGNLALKYKINLSFTGDTKLLEVLEFSALVSTPNVPGGMISLKSLDEINSFEGHLLPASESVNGTEPERVAFKITAKMKTTAGNEYQGLTLGEIKVNVVATQYTYEYDSNGNNYDAGADMSPDNLDHFATVNGVPYDSLESALENASAGSVITLNKSTTEPIKLENTEPITIEGITFKSISGVSIKGMQLAATSEANKVTLKDVKFEGINFTDRVVLGQSDTKNGISQCSDISFENCTFDMSASTEGYKDAICRGSVRVSGDITDEKEANAYAKTIAVKNCEFKNARNAINVGKVRDITVEGCRFTDLSNAAINLGDLAGEAVINGNSVNNAKGVLNINTVGNNYSTKDITTNVTIKNNTATNMTCDNGDVFCTTFDNAKASGKSIYTITGNSCSYTQSFDAPLNGFKIKKTYSPSKAEFIANK